MSRNRLGTRRALRFNPKPAGPPPSSWPFGLDGDLIQTGGSFAWASGSTYDYNSITLNGVNIIVTGQSGAFALIGCKNNFSMVGCSVNGNDNEDITDWYDGSGNPVPFTYTVTSPAGDIFTHIVESAMGGGGGSSSTYGASGGSGLYGSGGGGGSDSGGSPGTSGNDGSIGGGGSGAPGDGTNGGGGDGGSLSGTGAAIGQSGQNIAFKIAGNVTSFTENILNFDGSNGSDGSDGGNGGASGGGGGGGGSGGGGFGGGVFFKVHGTGSGLLNDLGQINIGGGSAGNPGAAGSGGSGSGGPGTSGTAGNNGILSVTTY